MPAPWPGWQYTAEQCEALFQEYHYYIMQAQIEIERAMDEEGHVERLWEQLRPLTRRQRRAQSGLRERYADHKRFARTYRSWAATWMNVSQYKLELFSALCPPRSPP